MNQPSGVHQKKLFLCLSVFLFVSLFFLSNSSWARYTFKETSGPKLRLVVQPLHEGKWFIKNSSEYLKVSLVNVSKEPVMVFDFPSPEGYNSLSLEIVYNDQTYSLLKRPLRPDLRKGYYQRAIQLKPGEELSTFVYLNADVWKNYLDVTENMTGTVKIRALYGVFVPMKKAPTFIWRGQIASNELYLEITHENLKHKRFK